RNVTQLGGTMRLGQYECRLVPGTRAHKAYGKDVVWERHRHRFEFNNEYRERFGRQGFVISGTSPDGKLVEVVELPDHPWFVSVECNREFKSKPTAAHPLFRAFVAAGLVHRGKKNAERSRGQLVASS